MTLLILRDLSVYGVQAVPDPDLRENGGEGGKQSPQKIFGPFEPHLGPKIRGGGQAPWALPWICHYQVVAKTEPYVGMVLIL